MLYEPLKNKKQKILNDFSMVNNKIDKESDFYLGFKKGVDESFKVFSTYIDFFKRYKNNVKLLMNEQRDVWLKFVKYYETLSDTNSLNYLNKYNNWLFNYIFCDIIDENYDDFLGL
ncbi:MAG: hypothetical protein QHH15_07765 [Candidatus Thermoplasmatota archaeon]|jgi:hypothetical protein|nr:hypothetical protein [Candidatus Thermoplasmatota archaeon]